MSGQPLAKAFILQQLNSSTALKAILTGGFYPEQADTGVVPPYLIYTCMSDVDRRAMAGRYVWSNHQWLFKIVALGKTAGGSLDTAADLIQPLFYRTIPVDMGARGAILGCSRNYTPPAYPENDGSKTYMHIPVGVYDFTVFDATMAALVAQ